MANPPRSEFSDPTNLIGGVWVSIENMWLYYWSVGLIGLLFEICRGYVGIHSSGFRDFLLKPELLRAIVDSGFEHPSEGVLLKSLFDLSLCLFEVCTLLSSYLKLYFIKEKGPLRRNLRFEAAIWTKFLESFVVSGSVGWKFVDCSCLVHTCGALYGVSSLCYLDVSGLLCWFCTVYFFLLSWFNVLYFCSGNLFYYHNLEYSVW